MNPIVPTIFFNSSMFTRESPTPVVVTEILSLPNFLLNLETISTFSLKSKGSHPETSISEIGISKLSTILNLSSKDSSIFFDLILFSLVSHDSEENGR